jgi:transcription elongation factor Elf1
MAICEKHLILNETIKFSEKKHIMEIRKYLRFQEIETALRHLGTCPKCNSSEGFWLGAKRDHIYVQCKSCGANLELFEVYTLGEKLKKRKRLRFFDGS